MRKKFLTFFSVCLVGLVACTSLMGCGAGRDKSKINPFEPNYYTDANSVESVDWVAQITGENCENKTYSKYKIGGTDLGIPVYNSKNDTMYVFFGDTYLSNTTQSGLWRSNVCLTSKDFNLSDGLTFNGALNLDKDVNGDDVANAIIEGLHINHYEITKIPTGGIEIDGNLYMFYFSKAALADNLPRSESMNYGGCVKSADNGKTWTKLNNLSWADHLDVPTGRYGLPANQIEELINLGIDNKTVTGNVNIEDHVGYNFTQIVPIDGKDGYIYLLGEGGYRLGGIKLARVKKADFEKFEEYEYFLGIDISDNPIWEKGAEGLRLVEAVDDAYIIEGRCGEHSVMYNQYLKKWVVSYLSVGTGIVIKMADNIWGPYGETEIILSFDNVDDICPPEDDHQLTSIYGGYIHEEWVEGNGRIMYMVFSQFAPLYNSSLLRIQFYEDLAS